MPKKVITNFENIADIGRIMREKREAKGWTLNQVAEKLDVSPTVISNLEGGHRPPSNRLFDPIMNTFGFDLEKARAALCKFKQDECEQKYLLRK